MKITVKKEYDTAEVVEKLEKVLRKMEDRAYVMVDKDDIKAIIDIIKYFESDYQKYKSETLKKAEKLEKEEKRFKIQREQLKKLEESRIEQNKSVIEKTVETCTPCCYDKEKFEDNYIVDKMKVADIKVIFSCFGGYDKSLICCCTFCGVRELCKEYTQKSINNHG